MQFRIRARVGVELVFLVGAFVFDPAAHAAPSSQADPNVVVQLTSPRPGQRVRGPVEIAGYAVDRRSPSGAGIEPRNLRIYLNDPSDERNLLRHARGGQDSSAAATALEPRFRQSGFSESWDTCAFPAGSYKLIVVAASQVVAGAGNVRGVDVIVEPCPPGETLVQAELSAQPDLATIRLDAPGIDRVDLAGRVLGDFAVGLDARCTQPDIDCGYALNFRRPVGPGGVSAPSHYDFYVNPMVGSFLVYYWPAEMSTQSMVPLVPITLTPAIRQGTATNRLAVIAQGDRLRFFVNGQQVAEVQDSHLSWGVIGWTADTRAAGVTAEARFANLVVSTVGPLDALAPVLVSAESPAAGTLGVVAPTAPLRAVGRPDLLLTARDLPPGYDEQPFEVVIRDHPVEGRRFERTAAGVGPGMLTVLTYQLNRPVRMDDVADDARLIIAALVRGADSANMRYSDWDALDPAGLGDHATLYSYRVEPLDGSGRGDGAVAVFARGDVVTIMNALSFDGRATIDLRQYARIVDARIVQQTGPAGR
jgi:hypothetical protein